MKYTGKHPIYQALLYLVLMMAFFVVYKIFDPLGLESATKYSSATLFNAATTPFYGMSSVTTHKNVAVVAINDNSLEAFDTSFPLSYARHIDVLNKILNAHPAALFVDFRMMHERPGESLEQFAPIIARARQAGVPLFFARGDSQAPQASLPEPLTSLGVYNNGILHNGTYPLVLEEEEQEEKDTSERLMSRKETISESADSVANPAFALYKKLCATTWKSRCGPVEEKSFSAPMVIHWGLAVDPEQSLVSRLDASIGPDGRPLPPVWQSSHPADAGRFSRLCHSLSLALRYALAYTKPTNEHFFPYPLVIGAEQLDYRGLGTAEGAPVLASLLKGRAVFYGADLRDQHDDTLVPLLGWVPGVVAHAMAFDNLVVYGPRYFKEPGKVWKVPLDWAECTEAVLWGLFSLYCIARFPPYRIYLQRYGAVIRRRISTVIPAVSANTEKTQPLSRVKKGAGLAVLTLAMAMTDFATRETWHGWQNIVAMYCLLFLLFLLTWANPFRRPSLSGSPSEDRGLLGQIFLIASLSIIGFFFNENFRRWPNADWIGLLLLYMATRNDKDAEEERNRFVVPIYDWVTKMASMVQRRSRLDGCDKHPLDKGDAS